MDEHSEPTHISPVFFDLLRRQFLPVPVCGSVSTSSSPLTDTKLTRKPIAWNHCDSPRSLFLVPHSLVTIHIFVFEAAL